MVLRLGTSVGVAGALGVFSSQRAWSQGIRPLTSAGGSDPAAASVAVVQLAAAALVLVLVLSTLAEVSGRILGSATLGALAERATPARLRSMWGRVAGLALGASVSLACQVRTSQPPQAATPATIDHTDPPAHPADPAGTGTHPGHQPHRGPTHGGPAAHASGSATTRGTATLERIGVEQVQILDATRVEALPATWTVGPGDHLWRIAEETLGAAQGRPPADAEVARYWQRLILENPDVTDPDLVLPGQVIALPAV